MCGEIAAGLIIQFMERIKEGKVYELRRFLVTAAKKLYKPVVSELMIRFGRYTTVREIDDNLMDYPMAHVYLCFDPKSMISQVRLIIQSLSQVTISPCGLDLFSVPIYGVDMPECLIIFVLLAVGTFCCVI
jgi:hypothetical protein